ncbi:MAG: tripartite tricarboxylate transporter substrate binding protein [Pseudomonadota bacterium]
MMLTRRSTLGLALAASLFATPAFADWQPDKPIRIIVPWGAGGSTDQLARTLAGDLEEALGTTVVVVNQPGGAGAVGTKAALDAEADGYTWTAGATKDLGTYVVTGALDTQLKDWHLYLATVNFTVLSANANSELNTIEDIVAAMKSGDGSVTIATGGINSAGGASAEALKAATDGDYKMVTYDGGAPAVQAAAAGETELTTQLIAEQYEMLRAGRLTPIAAFTDDDVTMDEIGTIPSIKGMVPGIAAGPVHFGVFVPGNVPDDVITKLDEVWDSTIANSERLSEYAASKGLSVLVMRGQAAQDAAFPVVQMNAWQIHDGGKSIVSPDEVGIPRPQ